MTITEKAAQELLRAQRDATRTDTQIRQAQEAAQATLTNFFGADPSIGLAHMAVHISELRAKRSGIQERIDLLEYLLRDDPA